jgi:hypothetical protein
LRVFTELTPIHQKRGVTRRGLNTVTTVRTVLVHNYGAQNDYEMLQRLQV